MIVRFVTIMIMKAIDNTDNNINSKDDNDNTDSNDSSSNDNYYINND